MSVQTSVLTFGVTYLLDRERPAFLNKTLRVNSLFDPSEGSDRRTSNAHYRVDVDFPFLQSQRSDDNQRETPILLVVVSRSPTRVPRG